MDSKQLTNNRFGKWGWSMIIYTLLLYYIYAGLCVDSMNLYPDAFAGLYGMDRNLLLGLATPAGVIGVLGGVVFGHICMKTGVRLMSGVSLIIAGILYVIFGFASTPVMYLIVLTALCFVANAFGLISTATLMGNWFPRKKGIALGWATMGAPLATATFVALLGALYGTIGLPMTSVGVGIVVVLMGIVTFFWVKDYPEEVGAYPDNIKEDSEQLSAQLSEMKSYRSEFTVGRLLRDKDMWLIAVGFGLLWMVTVGIVSQFVPRMISVWAPAMGAEAAQGKAMLMLTVAALIGLVGSYFWGWLDQKVGTKPASCVYSLSYVAALLLLIFAQVEILIYIAVLFVGFGIGGLLNLMPSLVISVYGRHDFQAANSLVSPIASLLQKAAFALMAVLLTVSKGDYTLPYAVFIGVDVLGLILLLCVTNQCKGRQD